MSVTQSGPYCTKQWEVNLKPGVCGTMFVTLIPSVSALSPCVGSSVGMLPSTTPHGADFFSPVHLYSTLNVLSIPYGFLNFFSISHFIVRIQYTIYTQNTCNHLCVFLVPSQPQAIY